MHQSNLHNIDNKRSSILGDCYGNGQATFSFRVPWQIRLGHSNYISSLPHQSLILCYNLTLTFEFSFLNLFPLTSLFYIVCSSLASILVFPSLSPFSFHFLSFLNALVCRKRVMFLTFNRFYNFFSLFLYIQFHLVTLRILAKKLS